MESKTVLVIDNESAIRANILRVLQMEGYRACEAENGHAGLALARSAQPDLILCDVVMPEMDGYTLLAELRRDPATAAIPFILLTASVGMEDMRAKLGHQVNGFLAKPFKLSALLAMVSREIAA